jgi:hypothetical protein
MYPPVTQFETRRLRLERELQTNRARQAAKAAPGGGGRKPIFLSRVAARWNG